MIDMVCYIAVEAVNVTLYEEDEDVALSCRVSGVSVEYTVTWLKEDQVITQSERPHLAVNDSLTVMSASEYN